VKRFAVAVAEVPIDLPLATAQDLNALRRRLAGAGAAAQEAVLVDFLEDDLREAEGALGVVTDYVASIESALRDARVGRKDLLALALGGGPVEQIEYLTTTLASLRRRLAQIAVRLPG
jgi:hypothetical protein